MKKTLILAGSLLLGAMPVTADHRMETPAQVLTATVAPDEDERTEAERLFDEYRFDEAADLLEDDIAKAKRRRKPTEEMERLQLLALRAASMLDATEKVVFIDSMVVDKQQFVDHYRIGRDAGRVGTYRTLFPKGELQLGRCGQSAFVNELGDMAYVAVPDTSGDLKLSRAERAGGQWSRARALAGLAERTGNQDFPFVMADGITLYYAEESDEGLGGYDIYVTRYNSDDERFVKPENIGMPFNSPANDYLYAIDEFNNLGWFATDRNQPAGKVCIYTFIPNPSRETYVLTEYNADEVRAAARIASVARTQAGSRKLAEAKAVLAQLRAEPAEAAQGSSFSFITADGRLFTSVRQLPDAQSRKLGEQWSAATTQLSQQREQLDQMRRSYAAADAGGRQQMTSAILKLEKEVERLETQADRLASQLRQAVRTKQ